MLCCINSNTQFPDFGDTAPLPETDEEVRKCTTVIGMCDTQAITLACCWLTAVFNMLMKNYNKEIKRQVWFGVSVMKFEKT